MATAAAAVAGNLCAEPTRSATLDALDAMSAVPGDVALAAAPALVDVAACTEDHAEHERATLLLARLLIEAVAEAVPEPAPLYGAAFAGERLAAFHAPRVMAEATQLSRAGQPLTRKDARSYASLWAPLNSAIGHGWTGLEEAAGRDVMGFMNTVSQSRRLSCPRFLTRLSRPSWCLGCAHAGLRCDRRASTIIR
jgi:hypothetical protein